MSAPNCLVLAKASKSILWRYCCVPLIFSKEVNSWSSDIIFQTLSKVSNVLSFISFSNCLNSVKFLPSSLMHGECIENLKELSVWYLNILFVLWKHLFLHYSDFSPFHHLGNCIASWLGSKKDTEIFPSSGAVFIISAIEILGQFMWCMTVGKSTAERFKSS